MGRDHDNVSQADDSQLVERALAGGQSAFRGLYDRYQRQIYALVGSMVGQGEDVDDIVQEAFIRAFRSLKSFKGRSSFYTWLYRIAINAATDYRRTQARQSRYRSPRPLEEIDRGPTQIAAPQSDNPEADLYRGELSELMNRALKTLSDDHRQVIVLREIGGLSYQEIAEVTETTAGTVMSRLHYGRRKLAETLRQWDALGPGA